jgi:hypothetical protein
MEGFAVTTDSVDDLNRAAIPGDRPDITWLTAAPGVENRTIEEHAAFDYLEDISFSRPRI